MEVIVCRWEKHLCVITSNCPVEGKRSSFLLRGFIEKTV